MVDDPVEDGLGPGGRSAKLLQHHWRHAPVQSLQIISVALSICPAFGHFFSEKLFSHIEIWIDSVNFHIQPELGALRFNDVDIRSVDGSDTAQGRLPILLNLIGYVIMSMACSVLAVRPACRASLAMRSLMRSLVSCEPMLSH